MPNSPAERVAQIRRVPHPTRPLLGGSNRDLRLSNGFSRGGGSGGRWFQLWSRPQAYLPPLAEPTKSGAPTFGFSCRSSGGGPPANHSEAAYAISESLELLLRKP